MPAEIHTIGNWNAQASAHDAAQRVNKDARAFIAVWMSEDGLLHYTRHTPEIGDFAACLALAQQLLNGWAESSLEERLNTET